MSVIVPEIRFADKQKLLKHLRGTAEAGTRVRYLIIINLLNGRGPTEAARALGVARSTIYTVARRFRERGEWGLLDGREDNGAAKLDESYLATLYRVVRGSPQDYGWRRPTWTRELLVETLARQTGVRVHVATMSKALARIAARRGRPRPTVRCPWSEAAKTRRLQALRRLLARLPRNEEAFFADEVDIHLNPKVGLDWMVRGQQKEVVTPGQNAKRFVAGAWDVRSGEITWAEGERKASALFIALLEQLLRFHPRARCIHVIVDNYRIHSSKITQAALQGYQGRIRLHFLPPYCPNDNRIERVWEDLHAQVTRNHTCPSMDTLMAEVREFLCRRNRILAGIQPRRVA